MTKITKYLDPAPDQGGNGSGAGAEGGAGNAGAQGGGTPPDAVAEAEMNELNTLLEKGEDQLSADEKVKFAALSTKYKYEELDGEGKPLTKEAKEALEKTNKRLSEIKAKPEGQRTVEEVKFLNDNTQVEESVYDKVDALYGAPIEVDYKDIDPNSPEGILLREDTIREQAIDQYDNELKEKYQPAYQFLLHLQAGGQPEDFFKQQSDDFLSITISKTDLVTQESVYRKALSLKGNTPEQIDTLVTAAKDKQKLFDYSKTELEALQQRQEKLEKDRVEGATRAKQQEKQLVNTYITNIDKTIEKGIQGVSIPRAERKAFAEFVAGHTTIMNGKLVLAEIVDPNKLEEALASTYFRFKKANLANIVENKAKDLNTRKFVKNRTFKITPRSANAGGTKNYVALGDL